MLGQNKRSGGSDRSCAIVVALAVGAFLIANLVRFFGRPDAWQQVRDYVGGLALCCGGFLVFLLLVGVFSSRTNRPSTSIPREWRALCRTYPAPAGARAAVGGEGGQPLALAAEVEEVTVRVSSGWLEVSTQRSDELPRQIPFSSLSLNYVLGAVDGALDVGGRLRQWGRLSSVDGLSEMTIVVECSDYWSGPPSPALQLACEWRLVAVDAAGVPDMAATRELYSFIERAIEEERAADAAAYGL